MKSWLVCGGLTPCLTLFLSLPLGASAPEGLVKHSYKKGEKLAYTYEGTDILFALTRKDGTVQAGEPLKVQEIQVPALIELSGKPEALVRRIHLAPSAGYRESAFNNLAKTAFESLSSVSKHIPDHFTYAYQTDTEALDNLPKIYESLRKDDIGNFLFFKMQDFHQMLDYAEKIPQGLCPGQTHQFPERAVAGTGGTFLSAPSTLIYQGIQKYEGIKSGYFKFVSLGNRFSMPSLSWMKTYTNFFFTLHVALEGKNRGLLLFGEGQETATVLKQTEKGHFEPLAIVQRQFSLRKEKQASFKPAPSRPEEVWKLLSKRRKKTNRQ